MVIDPEPPPRRAAVIALLLLVPAPSLGVLAGMYLAPGAVGRVLFLLCKAWVLVLPAAWWVLVEKQRASWSPASRGGLLVGFASGLVIAATILATFVIARPWIAPELLLEATRGMALDTPAAYLWAAAGWIGINSLLEEYVYRWFVLTRCESLMPRAGAVAASALIFTAHHVLALAAYLGPGLTALASLGVFIGGATWAWCYARYRSIWPGWLSHILADAAVFWVGWELLF
jgi:membrane protease YdiL (CAAX protease family)